MLTLKKISILVGLIALLSAITSCQTWNKTPSTSTFTLQLLHLSDMDGNGTEALVENAPRISSLINSFRNAYPEQTLFLSSGDNYIPGPAYFASNDKSLRPLLGVEGQGRADIAILNALGLQASTFGNHEFDLGTQTIASQIKAQEKKGTYPGARFPYLSSNLDFSTDPHLGPQMVLDGQEANTIPNKIAHSAILTVQGEKIGVVGATTPLLNTISSPGGHVIVTPSNPDDLDALAQIIQQPVDILTKRGINKIIVLAHMQQFSIEDSLTSRLKHVDIIVAGGSNTLLKNQTDRLRPGDTASKSYPQIRSGADGKPVLLVNCGSDYRYLCRLVVAFNPEGVLLTDRLDPTVNGTYAADDEGVKQLGPPDPNVINLSNGIKKVLISREGTTFGQTDVFLEGRGVQMRTEETNFGNLLTDALLNMAQTYDNKVSIALSNGGGIRTSIGTVKVSSEGIDTQFLPPQANVMAGKKVGQISQFDIQNALLFNNELIVATLTAQQLQKLIEHGVAATAPGATPGQFPQISGIRFSYDPKQTAGKRVQSLVVVDDNGKQEGNHADKVIVKGVLQGDPSRTFGLVTNGFIAGKSDGYPFPDVKKIHLKDQNLPDGLATFAKPGTEQDALAEYLIHYFPKEAPFKRSETPPTQDERIQKLDVRSDTVFE